MNILSFKYLKLVWLCILTIAAIQLSAQEICDNGIDDDNDGQIDIYDTDCACSDLMASSLIPNPSFEEMNCCPTGEAQLNCAVGWIQASAPTTDYLHECDGILGNPFLGFEAPLPFPDGQGGIGFRDGKPGSENFKEYAGSCLTQSMTVGTEYRLDFFVGFHSAPGSLTFDMAIFGSTQCANLPFGNNNTNFGCPTNGPGWVQLGAMTVTGQNEWKNVVFDFVADQSYDAIVLGPACAINPNVNQNPYFFFDRLVLAESIMFEIPLAAITGNICDDNLLLTSSDAMGGTYQWYQDGAALLNETGQSLSLTNTPGVEGIYEVVVTTSTGCFNGEAYELTIPSYEETLSETFCEGGSIIIAGQEFDTAGTYDLELIASDGCDSLVTLILASAAVMTESLSFDGCEGDVLTVNNENYTVGGNYSQNFTSADGCDSILNIQYTLAPNSSAALSFAICNGEVIDVNGQTYSMGGQYTQQLSNTNGCDSILNISITNSPAVSENISYQICDGQAIIINGESFNQSGTYSQNLTSTTGCDSILNVSIINTISVSQNLSYEICGDEEVVLNGQVYNQTGSYTQTLINTTGCDTTLTISIASSPAVSGSISYEICGSEEIVLNGQSYNQAGSYNQNLISAAGCDSILTVNITQLPNSEGSLEYSMCDTESVTFNGELFNTPGTFTQTLIAANGCDSIITINIASAQVCRDCCFYEEFTSGSIVLTKIDDQNYKLGLVHQNEMKLNMEMSYQEVAQFSALYLVDNEVLLQGKKSKIQELMDGHTEMKSILSKCKWNKSKQFNTSEISKALPYAADDLPEELNNKKLDLLYNKILSQCDGLPVGGQMKLNFR